MRGVFVLITLASLGIAGCASSSPGSSSQMAGVAPMLSVERFLQAVNTDDLDAMARIFGTAGGSIAETPGNPIGCAFKRIGSWIRISQRCVSREEIELWMNAIALVLRHDDYTIRGESSVAGRRHPTTRIGVDLVQGNQVHENVPFLVVRTPDGRWLLEEIGLETVTGDRRR